MTDDPITAYGEAWLAVDEDERSALLEVAWAPDAVYSDPLDHLQGREALGQHIARPRSRSPADGSPSRAARSATTTAPSSAGR